MCYTPGEMAKIKVMPGKEVVSGFKGKLDYYVWMGIPCVRKWPRSPGGKRAPAVEAQWPLFSLSATLWNELSQEIRDAYETMASNTGLSGRDMFTRSYIAGYKKLIATVDELEEGG